MPWQIVILLSLDQAPTFYHLYFQCRETSLSVPLTWSFLPASYPMGYPFRYKHLPHLCQASSPSLRSCAAHPGSLESEGVNIPRVCGRLVASRESFSIITVCTFISQSPLLVILFGVMWVCLLLGDQEATQLHVLPAISDLKSRCMVTSYQQTWREVTRWCASVTYVVIYALRSWEVKFVLYTVIQLIFHEDSHLKSFGENRHYLIKM